LGRQLTGKSLIVLKPALIGGFLFQFASRRQRLGRFFNINSTGRATPHTATGMWDFDAVFKGYLKDRLAATSLTEDVLRKEVNCRCNHSLLAD
jgi:hypothetical protein